MFRAISSVWALFFGIAMLMLGNGLQGSLLGLRAGLEGFGTAVIGAVMAGYFVGFLLGSLSAPVIVGRVGHIRVFAALASLASTAALLFAIFVNPVSWFLLRVLLGFCFAGLYVVAESWLNHDASNETRGQILSFYMIIMFAFMGLGQFLLNLAPPDGYELFILVSALVSLALVPISLTDTAAPKIEVARPVEISEIYKASPLGVLACFGCGVAQGAQFAMAPVYAAQTGLSVAQTSLFLGLPFFGVVLAQYPIGLLSDRIDRRLVMIGSAGLTSLAALGCLWAGGEAFWTLAGLFAVYGALSLPLYSLAIAHTNDNLDNDQRIGGGSKLVLIFGLGSTLGPVVIAQWMAWSGPSAFFAYLVVVNALIAAYAIYRRSRSAAVSREEKGEFVFVAARATPFAAGLAIEEQLEDGDDQPVAPAAPAKPKGKKARLAP